MKASHRVLLLSAVLLAATAALVFGGLPAPRPITAASLGGGALLVATFALAEVVVLHFDIGDEAYTASISEVPLVAGLLLLDPWLVIAARVVGAVLALALWRRQPVVKMWFNTCSFGLEAALPAVLISHFARPGLAGWAVAAGAAIAGNVVSGLAVSAAIALSRITVRGAHIVRIAGESAVFAALSSTIAVLGVAAYRHDRGLALPLLVAAAGLALAYRGSTHMRRRLIRLTALQAAIRDFTPVTGHARTVEVLLAQAREKLRASTAVLVLVDPVPTRWSYDDAGVRSAPTTLRDPIVVLALRGGAVLRGRKDEAELLTLGLTDSPDAVVVPVPGSRDGAFLAVCGRRSDHAVFTAEDLTVLQGIAQHGSVSLANAALVDRLMHTSRHDALTGLANRVLFHDRLSVQVAHLSDRADAGCVVLLADLDGFKEVNDSLGHHTGDILLQRVAALLSASLDGDALLARLGGDEFAVLLPGISTREEAMAAAWRLREVLAAPMRVQDVPVSVGASVGVALVPEHGSTPAEILRHADVAMYAAKAGVGVSLYDPSADTSDAGRLALAADLRAGIRRGELRLHAQPKARASDGAITGAEALVRWEHPRLGRVSPDEFIPLAERTGVLGEITSWVLAAALDALQAWLLAGHDMTVSVNLSPSDLLDAMLPERVRAVLGRTGDEG